LESQHIFLKDKIKILHLFLIDYFKILVNYILYESRRVW